MQTLKIVLLALLVIVLLLICAGYALFFVGIVRFPKKKELALSKQLEPYAGMIKDGIAWFDSQVLEHIEIPSYDGTILCGDYLSHENAKGTIILFHGYRSSDRSDFSCAYRYYYELGYSLLSISERAHGESGGAYICFGVKERFDCRSWACYVLDRFGPKHDIYLSGLSMGATVVLMASGLELPKSVRAIVADCGFTSPYDEFKEVLKHKFHLPEHPFMDIAELFSRLFAGFGFKDCSAVDALKNNDIPVIFIHGEADHFVPARFSHENFEACRAEKKLITVPGAAHGMSFLVAPELVRSEVTKFIEKHSTYDPDAEENVSSYTHLAID